MKPTPLAKPWLLALLLAAVFGVLGSGIYLAIYNQDDLVQGWVDADSLKVSAKISARISKLYAYEGQEVSQGQELFLLDSPEVEAKYNQALAALEAAQAQSEKAEDGSRLEQIAAAEANWQRAKAEAELAAQTAARFTRLHKEGVISGQQKDEALAKAKASQAVSQAAKSQYDEAFSGARKEDKAAAAAQVRQAEAFLAEVKAAKNEIFGLAPAAGEVSKRLADVGELVPAGYPVFTLVDVQHPWVSFNLREDQFHQLAKGQVLTAAIPALNLEGAKFQVYFISPRGEFATWRATRQSVGYDLRSFEIRARPVEPIANLRPGMSVLFKWPQNP